MMGSRSGSVGDAKQDGGLPQGDDEAFGRESEEIKGKVPRVDASALPVKNLDRRMILMNQSHEEDKEEEEYDFGQDEVIS
jgi:hypothetical protein